MEEMTTAVMEESVSEFGDESMFLAFSWKF